MVCLVMRDFLLLHAQQLGLILGETNGSTPTHNSITPVEEMLKYGLTVAIGSDNIQDVYKPFSDGNMYTELKFLLECLHLYDIDALLISLPKTGD